MLQTMSEGVVVPRLENRSDMNHPSLGEHGKVQRNSPDSGGRSHHEIIVTFTRRTRQSGLRLARDVTSSAYVESKMATCISDASSGDEGSCMAVGKSLLRPKVDMEFAGGRLACLLSTLREAQRHLNAVFAE
jgi:hypothetical protein